MNIFEVKYYGFFTRYLKALFTYRFMFLIVVIPIIATINNQEYIYIIIYALIPEFIWILLRCLWLSRNYLYRINIDSDKIILYFLLFNKTKTLSRDICNTKVCFCLDTKSHSFISFGGKVKGYTYKESFCQYFICDWGKQYKDFAKFLNDNGIWNNYNEKIKL